MGHNTRTRVTDWSETIRTSTHIVCGAVEAWSIQVGVWGSRSAGDGGRRAGHATLWLYVVRVVYH